MPSSFITAVLPNRRVKADTLTSTTNGGDPRAPAVDADASDRPTSRRVSWENPVEQGATVADVARLAMREQAARIAAARQLPPDPAIDGEDPGGTTIAADGSPMHPCCRRGSASLGDNNESHSQQCPSPPPVPDRPSTSTAATPSVAAARIDALVPSGSGSVGAEAVEPSPDSGSVSVDVTDGTDYGSYWGQLQIAAITGLDAALWAATTIAVFVLFAFATPWWPLLEWVVKVGGDFAFKYRGYALVSPKDGKHLKLSLVSVTTPEFHIDFLTKLTKGKQMAKVLAETRTAKKFSFTLADFFLNLCALSYESNQILKAVFAMWGGDYQFTRFGHDGCCIMAVWSVKENFVTLVFKGTSPLDLSEWLTDCSLRKTPAKNGVLPGLIHTGFYSALGLPDDDVVTQITPKVVSDYQKYLTDRISNSSLPPLPFDTKAYSRKNFWTTGILPNILAILSRFPSSQKPDLWVTGHSLGGATASVFTSIMLWQRTEIGRVSPVVNVDWDKSFTLRGTYTFGTPKTGDTDYRNALETVMRDDAGTFAGKGQPLYQFWRVINANDPVCTVPGGPISGLGTRLRDKKAAPAPGRREIDPGTGAPASRLPGITLLDFQHIGDPIRLEWRSGGIYEEEREPRDVLRTFVKEVLRSPLAAVTSSTLLGAFLTLPVSPLFLMKDHIPSEYAINLAAAEKSSEFAFPRKRGSL